MLVVGAVFALAFTIMDEQDSGSTVVNGGFPVAAAATAAATPGPTPTPPAVEPQPHRDSLGVITGTGVPGLTVALTFDDGPSSTYTPQVLKILDEHRVTATFCVVGSKAESHPDLVEDIVEAGHALCDHTITHDLALSTRDEQRMRNEIGGTLHSIDDAAPDADVSFFRAPGGNFSANLNAVAASYNLAPLGWSVDTRDWQQPGDQAVESAVTSGVRPGSIVLLHDGGGDRSGTVTALDAIITALQDAGYEFVVPRT